MAEDADVIRRIMTKYFNTASLVVFKCWVKFARYYKRIRLFAEHNKKKRAIRTYIDFTLRGFRSRFKASQIEQRCNRIISVSYLTRWKVKLRGQMLLRNAAYLYVRSRARIYFLEWKRDVRLCQASDVIKANLATKLAKETLKVWVAQFFQHRAVSVIRKRAADRFLQTLVKPAFDFFKAFRIKMVRFRLDVAARKKMLLFGQWKLHIGDIKAKKARYVVANKFHRIRSFRTFATTALRLSKWNKQMEVLLYKSRLSKCKGYFAFWGQISRRRGWWRNARLKVETFSRSKILAKAFNGLRELTVVAKSLRSEMVKRLRKFSKTRLFSLCFYPWQRYTNRAVLIDHKLSRALAKRKNDTWWSVLRYWRDWVRTRKVTRRKGAFLTLRYEERVRNAGFMKYRTVFLWEQVYKEVVRKREELLLERCFRNFLGVMRKLRYGRKRAEALFHRSSSRLKADAFEPWKLWFMRRVRARANGIRVHEQCLALKKKRILKKWKASLGAAIILNNKYKAVRDLLARKTRGEYLQRWSFETKLFSRARVFNERALFHKFFRLWRRYATKRKGKHAAYSRVDIFANRKRKMRLFETLINFTSAAVESRKVLRRSEKWRVEYSLRKGLRKLGERARETNISGCNEAKALDSFYSSKGKRALQKWSAFLARRKQVRAQKKELKLVLSSRAMKKWSDRTRSSLRMRHIDKMARTHHEEKTKVAFLTTLQILSFGRKTERVNVVAGEEFYDFKCMNHAVVRLKENVKKNVERRNKSKSDKNKGASFFTTRVYSAVWRGWVSYTRYRSLVRKRKRKASLFFLKRVLWTWKAHLKDIEKGRQLGSLALESYQGALMGKCWGGWVRLVNICRLQTSEASRFSDKGLVLRSWKKWHEYLRVLQLLRGVLGTADQRLVSKMVREGFRSWVLVAMRDRRFGKLQRALSNTVSKCLLLLTLESWKEFCNKSKEVRQLRSKVFSHLLKAVITKWVGFVARQRALMERRLDVEGRLRRALLRRTLGTFLSSFKVERVKKNAAIRRRRAAFVVWKEYLGVVKVEKALIADMLKVFARNSWCKKALCKLYLPELGRSFLALYAYSRHRMRRRVQSETAVALYSRRVAEKMIEGWKEYVRDCRCLRLCDSWRGARMASIGLRRWRENTVKIAEAKRLHAIGKAQREEKVKEKFVGRWIEMTRQTVEIKGNMKKSTEWAEWKGKLRGLRTLLHWTRRRLHKKESTLIAMTHAKNTLLGRVVLQWARETGLISRAKTRARAMSAMREKRGANACFDGWKVVTKRFKRLRLMKEVVERRRKRRIAGNELRAWKRKVTSRGNARAFVLLLWGKLVLHRIKVGFKVMQANAQDAIDKEHKAGELALGRNRKVVIGVVRRWRKLTDEKKLLGRRMWLRMKGIVLVRTFGRWIEWVEERRKGFGLLEIGEGHWEDRVMKEAVLKLRVNAASRKMEAVRLDVGESMWREGKLRVGLILGLG
jgi:hypothetical protein